VPNFLAFRWDNAVRQVNRVVDYEVVARLADRFSAVENDESASSRPPWGAQLCIGSGPTSLCQMALSPADRPG
jgi:hypothetical protein